MRFVTGPENLYYFGSKRDSPMSPMINIQSGKKSRIAKDLWLNKNPDNVGQKELCNSIASITECPERSGGVCLNDMPCNEPVGGYICKQYIWLLYTFSVLLLRLQTPDSIQYIFNNAVQSISTCTLNIVNSLIGLGKLDSHLYCKIFFVHFED